MSTIEERLALLIEAKGARLAATDIGLVAKSAESEAVAADKATAANTKLGAANDKLALSESKLALAQAKSAGGGGAGSAEANAVAAAQDKARVSKAASAVASDQLAVSEAKLSSATSGLGGAADGMGATVQAAFAKFAPAALLAGIFKVVDDGTKAFVELTSEIRAFQTRAGGGAEEASLLVGQVKALGIDPQVAAQAMFKLGASIGDGTTKLGLYGVAIAKNKDGSTDLVGTFNNVRDAYNSSTDAANRDAIAKAVAGKAGSQLIPLLSQTTDQVRALDAATRARGAVFTQHELADGRALKIASAELDQSFKGAEIAVAEGMVPALTTALNVVTQIVDWANKANKYLGGGLFTGGITGLVKVYHDLTGATGGSAKAHATSAVDAKLAATATDNLTKAVIGEYDAKNAAASASRSVDTAVRSETAAQKALATLVHDGPVDLKAVATAKNEVASASKALESALDSETKAQNTLTKARQGATALDLQEANLKVAQSGDTLAAAQEKVVQARQALDSLQGSGSASASELQAAQNDLTAALHGVTQAQIDQTKAGQNLATVQAKGSASDPAVIAAQEAVANARDQVTSATERQATAAQNLRTAQAGDPAFADRLAAAQQAVADAHQNVAGAQDAQQAAAYRLREASDVLAASLANEHANLASVAADLSSFPGYSAIIEGALAASGALTTLNQDAAALLNNPLVHGTAVGPAQPLPNIPGVAGSKSDVGKITARASGGPIRAGAYLFGENGPEIGVFGQGTDGYMYKNGTGPPMGSRQTITLSTTVHSGATAEEIAHEQGWMLRTQVPPPTSQRGTT